MPATFLKCHHMHTVDLSSVIYIVCSCVQDMEQLLWREGDLYRASLTANTTSLSATAAAAATTQSAYNSSSNAGTTVSSVRKPSLITTQPRGTSREATTASHRSSTASGINANSTTAAQVYCLA
jgi:hypothetical protein